MKSHKKTSKWNVPMLSFPGSFLKLRPLLVYLIFEFLKNFIMGIMFAAGGGGGGGASFVSRSNIVRERLEEEFLM